MTLVTLTLAIMEQLKIKEIIEVMDAGEIHWLLGIEIHFTLTTLLHQCYIITIWVFRYKTIIHSIWPSYSSYQGPDAHSWGNHYYVRQALYRSSQSSPVSICCHLPWYYFHCIHSCSILSEPRTHSLECSEKSICIPKVYKRLMTYLWRKRRRTTRFLGCRWYVSGGQTCHIWVCFHA